MLFFCSVIYKYAALTDSEDISNKMSDEQEEIFIVPQLILLIVLIVSVFGTLIFTLLLIVVQVCGMLAHLVPCIPSHRLSCSSLHR